MLLFSELALPADLSTVSVLLFGLLFGVQHSFEPDHLAAVSTIVSEKRSILGASLVGGIWGCGHTLSLLLIGATVILLKFNVSEQLEMSLGLAVGVMLVLLGLNALRQIYLYQKYQREHDDASPAHSHSHVHKIGFNLRSLVVGMVHGLAGSGALTLLVASSIASPLLALGFILIFGVGSIGGMILAAFVLSLPLHLTADKFATVNLILRGAAGVFSFGLGLSVIYENASALFV